MRYGGVPIRRSLSGFQRSAEDDGGNHNAECTTNDEASQSMCKKCAVEVLDGQLAIMCDMCSIWFCNVKLTATFQNRDNAQVALTRDQCLTTT